MIDSNDVNSNDLEATRTTFGASEDGFKAIEYLVKDKGWFKGEVEVFRTAIAFGAARKMAPTQGGKYKTKFNIGTLEQGGRIRILLIEAGFTKDPYTYVNAIADAALRVMYEKAKNGHTLSSTLFDN